MFRFLIGMLGYALGDVTYSKVWQGCMDNVNCPQLCRIGFATCDVGQIPKCEWGYFLVSQSSGYECVQCPYYGLIDPLSMQCMDCYENSANWQNSRQCTYYYKILNGDGSKGAYVRQNYTWITLYYVTSSPTTLGESTIRNMTTAYQTVLCVGCESFCTMDDLDCQELAFSLDYLNIGVICRDYFYFENDQCLTCPIGCVGCAGSVCDNCQTGYALSSQICAQCTIPNCVSCMFDEENSMLCTSCSTGFVPSLDQKSCVSCLDYCLSCEYVSYMTITDPSLQYPTRDQLAITDTSTYSQYVLRCRQCESSDVFIKADGQNCDFCEIDYCQQCFQYLTADTSGNTTLSLDFIPVSTSSAASLCFQCASGYELSADKTQCAEKSSSNNCQVYNNGACVRCNKGIVLQLQISDVTKQCDQIQQCATYLGQMCLECYSLLSSGTLTYICSLCADGYYPDIFNGNCLKCPANCQTCWAYTPSYNLTSYIQMKTIPNYSVLLNEDKQVFCSQCLYSYQAYGQQCLGCSDSCLTTDSASNIQQACKFSETLAYCETCLTWQLDRSLIMDNSECIECPSNCYACRERTQQEIDKINPYYNPNNSVKKYGNLCYLKQYQPTGAIVFIDSYLAVPISCGIADTSPTAIPLKAIQLQRKCIKKASADVNIYCGCTTCGYSLETYYKVQTSSINMQFPTVDNQVNYQKLNKEGVNQFTLTVNFISKTTGTDEKTNINHCFLTKRTTVVMNLLQQVFTLQNLTVIFNGQGGDSGTERVQFNVNGRLILPNITTFILRNINLNYQYIPVKVVSDSNQHFGLQLLQTQLIIIDSTQGSLGQEYVKVTDPPSNQYSKSIYHLDLQNINLLILNNVEFYYLKSTDVFINMTGNLPPAINIYLIQVTFSNVKQENGLFLPTNGHQFNNIYISQFQIRSSSFSNYTVFMDIGIINLANITIYQLSLVNTHFIQGGIIASNALQNLNIMNMDIVMCNFSSKSIALTSPVFNIENLFLTETVLASSNLIKSSGTVLSADQNITIMKFKNFNIVNPTCSTTNCILSIQTPVNTQSILTNVSITNLAIKHADSADIEYQLSLQVTSALILLYNLNQLMLENIFIDNTRGITIFYMAKVGTVSIQNAIYDWSELNTFDLDGTIIQNPSNNLLPSSLDCAARKLKVRTYSQYLFYISEFGRSVVVNNLTVTRQLFIDSGVMLLNSYAIMEQYKYEDLNLTNLYFSSNNLVSSENSVETSLIIINSQQFQTTLITGTFIDNHLHQVALTQIIPIATILLANCNSAVVTLTGTFNRNRATQTSYGLIYILTQELIMKDSKFNYTNIQDQTWLLNLEESQLNDTKLVTAFFQVLSQGSNLYFVGQTITIQNTQLHNSQGLMGGSLYIVPISGTIIITQTEIINSITSLSQQLSSLGGGIFIDNSDSALVMNVDSLTMINSTARTGGGCIFFQRTKYQQTLTFSNSYFSQCQSLGYTFIDNYFIPSLDIPSTTLYNVTIVDNNYNNFISNLPQLQQAEKDQLSGGGSTMYQGAGSLTIRNCLFDSIKYISIISSLELNSLIIENTQFTNNILFKQSLLDISFILTQGYFMMADTIFFNNSYLPIQGSSTSCDALIYNPTTPLLSTQTCLNAEQNQLLVNDYENQLWFDEAEYEAYYKTLVDKDKYSVPQMSPLRTLLTQQITQQFNNSDSGLVTCLLSYIQYTESSTLKTTGLIFIQAVDEMTISTANLMIQNNICTKCEYGLISIMKVSPNNYINTSFTCSNNIIGYYGCVVFSADDYLSQIVPNQTILNQRLLASSYYSVISNSLFQNNTAKVGSAISITQVTMTIMNSVFIQNSASLIGGSIFYSSGGTDLYLSNVSFQANQAQVGGAVYTGDYTLLKLEENKVVFTQNQANYSENIVEYTSSQTISMIPQKYYTSVVYLNDSDSAVSSQNVTSTTQQIQVNISLPKTLVGNYPHETNLLILPSGQPINKYSYFYEYTQEFVPYEWVFRVVNLNSMGLPVINGQPTDYCDVFARIQVTPYDDEIKFTSNFTTPSRFFYNQSKGGYDMDSMVITYDYRDPNYLEMKFECPSVKIPVYKNNTIIGFNQNFNLFAQIKTFPCQPGESYQLGGCTICNPLIYQYNVAVDDPYCSQMNDNMMLQVSQAGIQLRPGFWRPYFQNDASEKCTNLQANCLGGWIPGDASCYTGHIGALCESCDIYAIQNSEIYTTTGQFQCTTCSSTSKFNTAIIAITSFIGFISMILAVQGAFEQLKTKLVEEALKNMGVLLKPEGGNLATLMKVFTNYFQIIQFISTFQISIPTSVTQGAKTAGSPAGSATSSTDCAIINLSDVDILYFRTMWAMLLPAFYLTGFICAYLIAVGLKLTPYKKTIVTTALIYQFLFLQPTFVAMFMPLASSRTVSKTPWVQQDLAYRYDSSTHSFWLTVYVGPMLLLWVLVLPLLFMFLVWKRRFELEAKQTRMTYGFFYNEYETNSYLWEFIKIFEKQAMVIILSYYAADIIVKGLLLVLVLILYGAYQVSVVPYKSRVLNGCDRMSTAVCAISLCLGVLWYSSQQNEGQGYLQAIIFVIIIFINLPFIVYLLLLIFEGYLIQFGPQIDKVRDQVNAKYPDIQSRTIRKLFINKEKMDKRVKFLWGVLRENVWATLELQRQHQVKFYKIFPPYDSLEIECHTEEEKQPLNLGQIQLQDGSVINQHVDNGLVFNRGTMIQSTGVVFKGNFQQLKQHGVGQEVWPDQTEYQGQYVNGKKNGYGKIVWKATNESYAGNFTNDLFNGDGTYIWANGQMYEGHWKEGKRHGFGKQTSETQVYEGEFENDLYDGKGKMTMGIKSLQGKWAKGKLQGEVMIKVKNSTRRGIFTDGKFVQWL